jgi:hypothetical protein
MRPIEKAEEQPMSAVEPARERIARRLQDAVDRLRRDMDEVEFWTEVLGCLTRPTPDYNEGTSLLNKFALPPQNVDPARPMHGLGPDRDPEKVKNSPPGRHSHRRHSGH